MILAIDPGPALSAYVLYDEDAGAVRSFAKLSNCELLDRLRGMAESVMAIEMIASYGMPVGREVFETCVWIGRFIQYWGSREGHAELVYRAQVKRHLCNSTRAKDGNVRQAVIDAFGGKVTALGNKKQPGPLYGVSGDVWSALAVAITYADKERHSIL